MGSAALGNQSVAEASLWLIFACFSLNLRLRREKTPKHCLLASTSVPLKPRWCRIYLKNPTAEQVISLISSLPLTEATLISQFEALNARLSCSTTRNPQLTCNILGFPPLKSVITSTCLHSSSPSPTPPPPYEMLPSWLSL